MLCLHCDIRLVIIDAPITLGRQSMRTYFARFNRFKVALLMMQLGLPKFIVVDGRTLLLALLLLLIDLDQLRCINISGIE
jgi:hypothetical protein